MSHNRQQWGLPCSSGIGLILLVLLLSACRIAPTGSSAAAPVTEPTRSMPRLALTPITVPHTPTAPLPTDPAPPPATVMPALTATPPPTVLPEPTITPSPIPDPAASFVAAMRPDFVDDLYALQHTPHYDLDLHINPAAQTLSGHLVLTYTNTTDIALQTLALRLYPNFPRDLFGKGGNTRMDITDTTLDGQAISGWYEAQDTAFILPFVEPLLPGQVIHLTLNFRTSIVPWHDGSWPLPASYPMLAVHEDGAWRLDVTNFPDRVYSESARYTVRVTLPGTLNVAASGSVTAINHHADATSTYHIVGGPIRQFALTVGDFITVQEQVNDVTINVHTTRTSGLDPQPVAATTAAALAVFERRFAPYPYRELDVHLLGYNFDGGDEYPGLIFVYTDGPFDASLRYVIAHEVAHQWWFALVGNDIYRQPWLDEAFAQYSGIIAIEEAYGPAAGAADFEREVMQRYRGALSDGDWPVGLAIDAYPNFNVYYRTVYGKGAFFLHTLRAELGEEAFFDALQHYYWQHRYRVATTADAQQAFETASGRDLEALFAQWVTGVGR